MFMKRGPGGPKTSTWTRTEGQQLDAFFRRIEARPRIPAAASGGSSHLEWMFTIDGDVQQTACVIAGAPVRHLVQGLTAIMLRKGVGVSAGKGTCEAYWVLGEDEVVDSSAGAQRRLRGGSGDLELRLTDGSTRWVSAKHVARTTLG